MTPSARAGLGLGRPVGAGLLAAAAMGALWVAARRYGRDRADQIIDWDQATSIALRACGPFQPTSTDETARLDAEYGALVREIAGPLASYTGTGVDLARTEVGALDRAEWIRINVASFRELLQPFEALYREVASPSRFDLPGLTAVGRLALSAELGVLLGYLGRRVLGQYDISLIGARAAEPGKLFFVEPNIRAVQLMLGLPHREFRLWLALHEATHAHEFEGHPWVRPYLNATLQEYLDSLVNYLREGGSSLRSLVGGAADRLWVGGSLIEALMTPYQRELVSRLQALMCVLEGYSNHVMNAIGRELLPHFAVIEQRVEARSRQKSAAELLFLRLTGLQMKLDQYRLGQAFVNQVAADRGIGFANRVWSGPENLPTEREIREPGRWIRRMDEAA